ncbi:MalY/PatB family protein [Lachnobacterium bovis]|uniref:MalY/PatB family protein n=1 Tax=Lachnobacterium bovis TaxID=140626 RepID=UPI0004822439|nr:MalY/PatB family protein [Lachnobacterium bovis]
MERNLDFDRIINRKDTDCLKYDFAKRRNMPEDVLPFWVADMDFPTTSYVEDVLIERAKHGIFGYSEVGEEYFSALSTWMKEKHNWVVKREWLIKTPGVVYALATAIKAFTNEGDCVLIQQPVYYPFSEVIEDNKRKIISNDLYLGEDNKYHIDFDDFETKIISNKIKLFILCSPHNPVGRVWTKDELLKMGDICLKHGVIVVSDEIHNDFDYENRHIVFSTLRKEYEDNTIVCTSPSKTFNLASMLISNIFIPNRKNRQLFRKQVEASGISQLSILGLVATQAAYEKGNEWYDAMIKYVKDNIAFVKNYVKTNMPNVKMIDIEGTYLVWLDFTQTGIDVDELDRRIIYEAKLWLDSGKIFGKSGQGFQRINVACPRTLLEEAMNRIKSIL